MNPPRPPATPRWILRRVLPWGPRAEAILGDLEEEYRDRLAPRPRDSADLAAPPPAGPPRLPRRLAARAWYWREALAVAWRYALEPEPTPRAGTSPGAWSTPWTS